VGGLAGKNWVVGGGKDILQQPTTTRLNPPKKKEGTKKLSEIVPVRFWKTKVVETIELGKGASRGVRLASSKNGKEPHVRWDLLRIEMGGKKTKKAVKKR